MLTMNRRTAAGEGLRKLWDATAVAYEKITGLPFRDLSSDDQGKWLVGLSHAFECAEGLR